MKTKASVELAFVVTLRNRRRIIEQTNDSEAIVSLVKYPQAEKREPCVKTKASVELAFVVTLRNRRRIIEQTNDSEAIVSLVKYPQPECVSRCANELSMRKRVEHYNTGVG